MKLTDTTLAVLRNYASINPNLVVEPGKVLHTIAEAKNLLSSAEVDVEFPQKFGIYDLSEFLSVMDLVDDPQLEFKEDYVIVSDGSNRSRTKYFFSDPEILTTPKSNINMPAGEVSFTLDKNTLSRVRKAASALDHEMLFITPSAGVLNLSIHDTQDETSNAFSIDVDGDYPEGVDFNFVFNIKNFKMIDGDYDVELSSKLISCFTNKSSGIKYWCALEKHSSYGG